MSAHFSLDLDLSPLVAWFTGAESAVRRGAERGVYKSALVVMAASKEIVPVGGPPTSPNDPAPGTLRDSGTVLMPEWNGNEVVVEFGYGGAAEEYALRQHEDLTYQHKPGQQAKYLEQPLLEDEPNMLGRIADEIQAELPSAGR